MLKQVSWLFRFCLVMLLLIATGCAEKNQNEFDDQMPQDEEFKAGNNYQDFPANQVSAVTLSNAGFRGSLRRNVPVSVTNPTSDFNVQNATLYVPLVGLGITQGYVTIPIKNVGNQGYCWIGVLNLATKYGDSPSNQEKNRIPILGSFGFLETGSNSCLAKGETGYIRASLTLSGDPNDFASLRFIIQSISYDKRKYYQPEVAVRPTAIRNLAVDDFNSIVKLDVDFKHTELKNDAPERELSLWTNKHVHNENIEEGDFDLTPLLVFFAANDEPIFFMSVDRGREPIKMLNGETTTFSLKLEDQKLLTTQTIVKIRVYSPFGYGNFEAFEDL